MSEETRYARGLEKLNKIDANQGQAVIDSLSGLAEDIGKYIIEFAFGDIYTRKVLTLKQREIITITSLLTQGGTEKQLHVHIHASLNVGLTQKEIIEVFIQCLPYVGFPKVLNAVAVAKQVFSEREKK